ncbi:unnamed protein product [Owenia fusiformis]|uniref:Uncharacterized protein n=1 Tax=Owenia fusiformis TaxID=6347 RepID=A0A8J1U830_OWEFU|nr:unnamed protein product [Owenia fusiformis]
MSKAAAFFITVAIYKCMLVYGIVPGNIPKLSQITTESTGLIWQSADPDDVTMVNPDIKGRIKLPINMTIRGLIKDVGNENMEHDEHINNKNIDIKDKKEINNQQNDTDKSMDQMQVMDWKIVGSSWLIRLCFGVIIILSLLNLTIMFILTGIGKSKKKDDMLLPAVPQDQKVQQVKEDVSDILTI